LRRPGRNRRQSRAPCLGTWRAVSEIVPERSQTAPAAPPLPRWQHATDLLGLLVCLLLEGVLLFALAMP